MRHCRRLVVGGRGNGRGLETYPCCYEDVVVPPQLSPDEVLGVDAQDEEDGGENGEGPVDGEDGAAAVFVGTRGELLGRGAHAGHGDDVARGCRSCPLGWLCRHWTGEGLLLAHPSRGHRDGRGPGAGEGVFGSQGARVGVNLLMCRNPGKKESRQSAERGVVGLPPFKIIPSPRVGVAARTSMHPGPSALWAAESGEWRGGGSGGGGRGGPSPVPVRATLPRLRVWSSGTLDGGRLLRRQEMSMAH